MKWPLRLVQAVLLAAAGASACGQQTGHYVGGATGIKTGSLPPPGFYFRSENLLYHANELRDRNGQKLGVDLDLTVFASAERFIWMTPKEILGAQFGVQSIIPFVYSDIELGGLGVQESRFGLSDVFFEALLSWRWSQLDLGVGYGFFAPTGEFDRSRLASPGKGFWTGMLSFGGTYYFDAGKTWAFSILNRFETHSRNDEIAITPGLNFSFEWGLSKNVRKIVDLGVVGYSQWQLTDDSGVGVTYDRTVHDRVFGIGPEISVFIPRATLIVSLRHLREFEAIDRAQGHMTTLSISKRF